MIEEAGRNCEEVRPSAWRFEQFETLFDILPMPSPAPLHLCAALPNARALDLWPQFPAGAMPSSGRVANGCGLTVAASRRRAIGEAIELLKSCSWGDEPIRRTTAQVLGDRAIRPERLNGFSQSQLEARDQENRRFAGRDWIPAAIRDDAPLDWIEAEDAFTAKPVLVPADAVLIGRREAGDPVAVAIADSNGCACGPTAEAAKRAALSELIERDAAARWWYGQRQRPRLAPDILGPSPELSTFLHGRSRLFMLFDITSDINLPVVAAASCEPDGTVLALGFAAKPSFAEAALAASVEMLATETSLPPWRNTDDDAAARAWVRQVRAFDLPVFSHALPEISPPEIEEVPWTSAACIAALQRNNCRVLFVDLSRGGTHVPVFRALSPELCHIRPRFGKTRLYAPDARDLVPVAVSAESDITSPILY